MFRTRILFYFILLHYCSLLLRQQFYITALNMTAKLTYHWLSTFGTGVVNEARHISPRKMLTKLISLFQKLSTRNKILALETYTNVYCFKTGFYQQQGIPKFIFNDPSKLLTSIPNNLSLKIVFCDSVPDSSALLKHRSRYQRSRKSPLL